MEEINIGKYIDFTNDNAWLNYQFDRIEVYTNTSDTQKAYCFSKSGVFCIFISRDYINGEKKVLAEILKHELAHGYFGHLQYIKGKEMHRQLLNILFDCSIHVSAANPKLLGNVCTYKSCNLPVLPPLVLFEKLKKEVTKEFIKYHLNDDLWKQKPISELEHQVIKHTIEQGLTEAQENGVEIPVYGQSAGKDGNSLGRELEYLNNKKSPEWLIQLKKYLIDGIPIKKSLSWHREPKNPIGENILKKGLSLTEPEGKCLFAIDCSYSMEEGPIQSALSALIHCCTKEGITGEAVFFDTKVSKRINIRDKNAILKTARKMGGGTDISPVIREAKPEDLVVCYTDGYFNFHGNVSKFKRKPIFIITPDGTKNEATKWGRVIKMTHDNDWSEPV